jgi:response regulator RpfG family c-di-GMP phosphodiesterase
MEPETGSPFRSDPFGNLPRGTETILLVEDDPVVRELASRMLSQQGYHLLEASNGDEALRLAQKQPQQKIDLLVTDVVMPQMGGKALANQLKTIQPNFKVLFTSGYADNAIVHHGILEPEIDFLQKPFSLEMLIRKVRIVLDKED